MDRETALQRWGVDATLRSLRAANWRRSQGELADGKRSVPLWFDMFSWELFVEQLGEPCYYCAYQAEQPSEV